MSCFKACGRGAQAPPPQEVYYEPPPQFNQEDAMQQQQQETVRRRQRAAQLRASRTGAPTLEPDLKRDLKLLRAASRIALVSYCAPEEAEARFRDAQAGPRSVEENFSVLSQVTTVPEFFGGEDCCGYLMKMATPDGLNEGRRQEMLVLAVRGSASLEDALCDTEVAQVPLQTDNVRDFANDVRVHEHFLKQYRSLETYIDPQIHDHLASSSSARLLCVGHSLGASVSSIAALVYAHMYPSQVWFVGMGMPMTGNTAFQREFDRLVGIRWRVKNSRDVVPKVRLSPYYTHVGRELLTGRIDPYPDVPMFSDLPDHFCTKYIAGLDTVTDSWWRQLDITAILPLRIHAAMINSSYRLWRYCATLNGE